MILLSDTLQQQMERENALMLACRAVGDSAGARKHWNEVKRLHKQRSPEEVRAMEESQGLL